ncbi:MAG: hypothetical protein H2069_01380 [Legionella sp.]|nr:hypothetical protein [Legionella sp.]
MTRESSEFQLKGSREEALIEIPNTNHSLQSAIPDENVLGDLYEPQYESFSNAVLNESHLSSQTDRTIGEIINELPDADEDAATVNGSHMFSFYQSENSRASLDSTQDNTNEIGSISSLNSLQG